MASKRDWLPDFIADWYDAFEPFAKDDVVEGWKRSAPDEVADFETRLCSEDPHAVAGQIQDWIDGGKGGIPKEERVYRALQAANGAFATMGIAAPQQYGGAGWEAIRGQWSEHGNLLHQAAGILLAARGVAYRWTSPRRRRKQHDIRTNFRQFARWRSTSNNLTDIDVRVISSTDLPVEDLHDRLKIGLVPLIQSKNDFEWREVERNFILRRFLVSIKEPANLAVQVRTAIDSAGQHGCDLVVMPELCLTVDIQHDVGKATRDAFAKYGHPWLVLAGTAHTPIEPGKDGFHNRARVFDGHGEEVLTYNKLHPYQMSTREQTRYALHEALGEIPRTEDITVKPRRFGIVESPIGRVGVLVCEDLSNEPFVYGLIDDLDLDWLLVPVMDGCQTLSRWTAVYASRCAERHASVVVVTTTSLYAQHLSTLDPPPHPVGIGLVTRVGQDFRPRVDVVPLAGSHADVCVTTYTAP